MSNKAILTKGHEYCPICGRVITACNIAEVSEGTHEGYIFVHDDVDHTDDDVYALSLGIQ